MAKRLLLALLSGLLLHFSWPVVGFAPLLFIAFLPLLYLIDTISITEKHRGKKVFLYSLTTFVTWHLLAAWWIKNADISGYISATVLNGLLMSFVFWLYYQSKRVLGDFRGGLALLAYWLCFEYIHFNWDLSYPWMTLGNGFAEYITWIQWYEYSGVAGGSLWVLLINLFLLSPLKKVVGGNSSEALKPVVFTLVFILAMPIVYSINRYANYKDVGEEADVVVLQPNIDAYLEKYEISVQQQVDGFIDLAESKLDSDVDYLVGPETAIPNRLWRETLKNDNSVRTFQGLVDKYPNLKVVIGITSGERYYEKATSTARPVPNTDLWYDKYNSAMQIDKTDSIHLYNKSKLVAGVEMMPFRSVLDPIFGEYFKENWGISGSMATQKERAVFPSSDSKFKVAPVICYESDYGEYLSGYIKNDANLIFVMTNDGWWGNTPGHKQHMHYSRLRAIEMRRSVARSANTGVSCFINQRGDVMQAQPWDTRIAIRQKIKANTQLTFYAKHGDIIYRIATFLAVAFIIYTFVRARLKGKISLK